MIGLDVIAESFNRSPKITAATAIVVLAVVGYAMLDIDRDLQRQRDDFGDYMRRCIEHHSERRCVELRHHGRADVGERPAR
jgi:hypothetical protein